MPEPPASIVRTFDDIAEVKEHFNLNLNLDACDTQLDPIRAFTNLHNDVCSPSFPLP